MGFIRPHKASGQSSKTILDVLGAYKPLASSQVHLRLWHSYRTLLGDQLAYKAEANLGRDLIRP